MKKLQIIKELEKIGCKILVNDIISDKHYDSFWYDGLVLSFDYFGTQIEVRACGEIRVFNKAGNLVYDCKERNEGFNFKLKDDNSLKKIGSNYDDEYYFDENNWFEVTEEDVDYDVGEGILNSIDEIKDYLKSVKIKDKLKEVVLKKTRENKSAKLV